MTTFWRPQSAAAAGSDGLRSSSSDALLMQAHNRNKHLSIAQQRTLLPIYRYRREILYALEKYTTLILVGETGCGKTTQLPQYLHAAGWTTAGSRAVVCTQPRRVAATAVAARVAEEFGCSLGAEVGYGVRFDFQCSAQKTVIKYVTDGVLLRETLSDPLLSKYSVVIVDEAHVRSLNSDILLGLLKKIKRKRPELRVVIMSATLNAQPLKDFFETNPRSNSSNNSNSTINSNSHSSSSRWDTATILSVQGRQYPVDILYLTAATEDYRQCCVDTVLRIHNSDNSNSNNNDNNSDYNNDSNAGGDVLVFLPGAEDVDAVIRQLQQQYQGDAMYFLPLYSALPQHLQQRVFAPTQQQRRKVIVATNIAEASVTIDGIKYVVDSVLEKLTYFDVRSGVEALITVAASKAAAAQRAGRAGRTRSGGKCFRLLTEQCFHGSNNNNSSSSSSNNSSIHNSSGSSSKSSSSSSSGGCCPQFSAAEMQRVDITAAVLQLKALGVVDVLHFDFLSPPAADSMIFALELLFSLDAVDDIGRITKLGLEMAELPVEPRLAHALLRSLEFRCCEEMLTVAAMCAVEYPFISIRSRGYNNNNNNNNNNSSNSSSSNAEAKQELQQSIEEFTVPFSDHLTLLNIYRQYQQSGYSRSWCDSNHLLPRVLQKAREVRNNLKMVLRRYAATRRSSNNNSSSNSSNNNSSSEQLLSSCGDDDIAIRKCITSGYFSHAARLGSDGCYRTLRGDVRVLPHPTSALAQFGAPPEWVIYNEIHLTASNNNSSSYGSSSSSSYGGSTALMREVTKIDPKWLMELAPHYYSIKK